MTPLTEEKLAEIRARLDAATPGPWEAWEATRSDTGDLVSVRMGDTAYWTPDSTDYQPGLTISERRELAMRDAEFVTHAREDVEVLLAEGDRLRRRVSALQDEILASHKAAAPNAQKMQRLEAENDAMYALIEQLAVGDYTISMFGHGLHFCGVCHHDGRDEHYDNCPIAKARILREERDKR